jgi:hypothetical protein
MQKLKAKLEAIAEIAAQPVPDLSLLQSCAEWAFPEGLHALHVQLLDGVGKGKEADGQQKKTCTTVQAADTPPSLLAADTFDLLQFLNKLLVFPVDDWSRTWAADRTMMLRMTSKKVRDAMDKLCLPTTVKMRKNFLHNLVNFAAKRSAYESLSRTTPLLKSQKSVCKTIALKRKRMQHIFTQLDSWKKMISHRGCHITKLDLNNCGMSDHKAGWLAAVHNEMGAAGAEILRRELTSFRDWQDQNEGYSDGAGKKGRGVVWLAGVLVQCPALAHLDLSYNDIEAGGAERLAGVLGQCAALAHLNLEGNKIGDAGAELLAGVLGQCTALTHLNLSFNGISDAGAERLTESWSGPEGGLFLDSEGSEEDWPDDEDSDWWWDSVMEDAGEFDADNLF